MVNGVPREIAVLAGATLLDILRDQLGLTGAKEACGRGECGACTVLVGDMPVMACVTVAALVDAPVTTIEGLRDDAQDLRAAFADFGSFQCGYCTPGQIVRAEALLRSAGTLTEQAVRQALSGNICRCTGYAQICAAVLSVSERRRRRLHRTAEAGT